MDWNIKSIRQQVLMFAEDKVNQFLTENPSLIFYAFAFDCNAEYGEVNLSFNTNESFESTLKYFQTEYPNDYAKIEDIIDLKYNPGNWNYICFSSNDFEYEDGHELENIEEVMITFASAICDFLNSEVFKKIPKSENFKMICIDHDEDVIDSVNRIKKINNNIIFDIYKF